MAVSAIFISTVRGSLGAGPSTHSPEFTHTYNDSTASSNLTRTILLSRTSEDLFRPSKIPAAAISAIPLSSISLNAKHSASFVPGDGAFGNSSLGYLQELSERGGILNTLVH